MSQPPSDIAENETIVFFDTNRLIPAGDIGRFLIELERFARRRKYLGHGGALELVEAQTGTFWARLAIIAGIGGGFASAGSFALAVADHLQKTSGKLPECAARIVIDHGVRAISIIDCKGGTEILRDMMPSIQKVEQQRAALPRANEARWDDSKFDEAEWASESSNLGVPSSAPLEATQLGGTFGASGTIDTARPANPYVPPSGDQVNFNFGGEAAKRSGAGNSQPQRDAESTIRLAWNTDGGLTAIPVPPATGDGLPITVAGSRVINFRDTKAEVRGHVLRINGRPIAFEVTDVLRVGFGTHGRRAKRRIMSMEAAA